MRFKDLPRSSGVLLPITALPGGQGCGDAGPAARAFVDWLAAQGAKVWQTLPLNEPGRGNSPYSSSSAFAISPLLISLDDLLSQKLLEGHELAGAPPNSNCVDYAAQRPYRARLLQLAAKRLVERQPNCLEELLVEQPELLAAAHFENRKRIHGDARWWAWPAKARNPSLGEFDPTNTCIAAYLAIQVLARRAWQALRDYAQSKEIVLLGDLPIYVDHESADAWQNPTLFALHPNGAMALQSGVPPDAFSDSGQLWRMPCFNWPAHGEDNYAWWRARLSASLRCFDLLRLDHFRGFEHYFAIDAQAEDARQGAWIKAPGEALLKAFSNDHKTLPLVAEDLGIIDDSVINLRDQFKLPGMHVMQFADTPESPHHLHNHAEHGVAYLGTHDNPTSKAWWNALPAKAKTGFNGNLGSSITHSSDLNTHLANSPARLVIHCLQDLLGLGDEARLNRPGVETNQWRWRHQGALPTRIPKRP
jgi:4-alpha-glucanotransferase